MIRLIFPVLLSDNGLAKVIRQSSFVRKMYDLGWTAPGFFDYAGDELALQHAISRYHAFVSLTVYYFMFF